MLKPSTCCAGKCSCCHDKPFELKVADSYDNAGLFSLKAYHPVQFIIADSGASILWRYTCGGKESATDAEPLIGSRKYPIYLTNRVFLI